MHFTVTITAKETLKLLYQGVEYQEGKGYRLCSALGILFQFNFRHYVTVVYVLYSLAKAFSPHGTSGILKTD